MSKIVALAAAAVILAAPAFAQQTKNTAEANFVDRAGTETGRAHLTADREGVLFEVEISGLTPRKWVATTASCARRSIPPWYASTMPSAASAAAR